MVTNVAQSVFIRPTGVINAIKVDVDLDGTIGDIKTVLSNTDSFRWLADHHYNIKLQNGTTLADNSCLSDLGINGESILNIVLQPLMNYKPESISVLVRGIANSEDVSRVDMQSDATISDLKAKLLNINPSKFSNPNHYVIRLNNQLLCDDQSVGDVFLDSRIMDVEFLKTNVTEEQNCNCQIL